MSVPGKRLLVVLVLGIAANAQNPPPTTTIPDRMVFRVVADNKIDTKHAEPGDRVKMLVSARETLDDGTVIDAGVRLEGHVVESVAYSPASPARLSLRIDRLQLKKRWIPLRAFIIAQGQTRTTRIIDNVNSPCSDPFARRSAADDVMCGDSAGARATPGAKLSSLSPVLRDVELVQTGTPPDSSILISHKGNIVIEENMAFLIRNAIPTPGQADEK